MLYYPHIDVEPMFTEMVRNYPMAKVLTDVIPNPKFLNADFIFHHEKVVAEFKRIEKDNFNSPNNQVKINTIIDKYFAKGKIKSKEITEENWRSLPQELQNDYYTILGGSIQGHIEKANKQIKETKSNLGLNAYKGCLIIVNDGVDSWPPAAFAYTIVRLLLNRYSGITYFIFFTANVFAKTRDHEHPLQYWAGVDMEKDGKFDANFATQLHKSWTAIICNRTGMPSFTAGLNDVEGFWKARNIPKSK